MSKVLARFGYAAYPPFGFSPFRGVPSPDEIAEEKQFPRPPPPSVRPSCLFFSLFVSLPAALRFNWLDSFFFSFSFSVTAPPFRARHLAPPGLSFLLNKIFYTNSVGPSCQPPFTTALLRPIRPSFHKIFSISPFMNVWSPRPTTHIAYQRLRKP